MSMSSLHAAWRNIAHRESGRETLNMSRSTLRLLFDEMDARASRAEADADRLAATLGELRPHLSEYAVGRRVGAALIAHDEAVAQR